MKHNNYLETKIVAFAFWLFGLFMGSFFGAVLGFHPVISGFVSSTALALIAYYLYSFSIFRAYAHFAALVTLPGLFFSLLIVLILINFGVSHLLEYWAFSLITVQCIAGWIYFPRLKNELAFIEHLKGLQFL